MSLKNGIYQLRFIPAGGERALGDLAATGVAIDKAVRILPNIPPLFGKQDVSVVHNAGSII